MRALILFALLVVVGLCAVAEASKHQHGGDRLAARFAQLEEIKGLKPKHRQLLERAVHEFESTIDKSKLDPAHKAAVKQKALDHFTSRMAGQRKNGH